MWRIWTLCLALAGFVQHSAAESFDYAPFNRTLGRVVNAEGWVNYEGVKADEDLRLFMQQLAQISPETHPALFPGRADSLAYWINAYNACVLAGVAKAYPIASVTDIALFHGFFKRHAFRVGGREMTLDHIEHEIIRKRFADPRIHAAINCAAVSCPRLQNKAFMPGDLDAQLHAAMRDMVRNPIHVQIDQRADVVWLSSIFKWFRADFTAYLKANNAGETLLDYLALFLEKDDAAYLQTHPGVQIAFLDYDWALNEQK